MKSNIKAILNNRFAHFIYLKENIQIRKGNFQIDRPIYHLHIRKTAGTTINYAFLSNFSEDPHDLYETLSKRNNHRMLVNDKIIVASNRSLINQGNYTYAWSHAPLHRLKLPKNTFVFTCLRDPVKRVISHYNMLMLYRKEGINKTLLKTECNWLGNSFDDFLKNIPKHHLLNQLYMFSANYNINEASEQVLKLDHYMFNEELSSGLNKLEKKLDMDLPISNQKGYGYKENISQSSLDKLREILKDEYILIENLKNHS